MPVKGLTETGRYPRGLETRQRIIDTAIEMFASQGFGGSSTRDIAAAAGVNTPAIQYYFGGKLGLYNACVDRTTAFVLDHIGPGIARCQAMLAQTTANDALIDCLCALQDCMIDSFFSDKEGKTIWRLLAWEDVENAGTAAKDLIQDRVGSPIFRIFVGAIDRIMPQPIDPAEAHMHAMSVMGLSMIFNFDQSRMFAILGQPIAKTEMLARLKAVTGTQLRIALAGLSTSAALG